MKSKTLIALLVLAVVIISGCGGGGGGASNGTITGVVYVEAGAPGIIRVGKVAGDEITKASGTPLSGATVTASGSVSRSATTDSQGRFSIANLPAGSYRVTVQAAGYADMALPGLIAVSVGQTTDVSDQNFSTYTKKWNFLVYLDGDNNLDSYGMANLNAMEQVGSTDEVNILVLIDRSSSSSWTGTRLYYVTKDTKSDGVIRSQLLVDYGEKDMSDPNTLRDFIVYCQTNYPAVHTVLDLWDHGGGVYPRGILSKKQYAKNKGICWDDTTGPSAWNCLTTDEVAQAFSQARTATGQKLDIIATDACLMQMLEVAYEWKDSADYMVGSEESIPGTGFDYATILTHLTANPDMTPRNYAVTMADDYYHYYQNSGGTTISALSLGSELTDLMTKFSAFAAALNNTSNLAPVYTAWNSTDSYDYPENKDLYDFARKLTTSDTMLNTATTQLETAIGNAVLVHHETGSTGSHVGKSFGLAILFPDSSNWAYYSGSNQYVLLKLSQDTMWNEFLARFAAAY